MKDQFTENLKKWDFIIIAVLLAAALVGYIFIRPSDAAYSATVVITVDGEIFGEYPLNKNASIDVAGHNKVVIKDSNVYISDADCPNHICIENGKITKVGSSIVCLPNKTVVTITD